MKLLLLAVVIIGVAVAGLAIRMIFIKGGKFSKTCSTADAAGEKDKHCVCETPDSANKDKCKYYAEHHPDSRE